MCASLEQQDIVERGGGGLLSEKILDEYCLVVFSLDIIRGIAFARRIVPHLAINTTDRRREPLAGHDHDDALVGGGRGRIDRQATATGAAWRHPQQGRYRVGRLI